MPTRWETIMRAIGDDVAGWIVLVVFAGGGASLLGLSMLLRSDKELTRRAVLGALLHSLMWGTVIFLISFSTLKSDLPMLLGLSMLSGMGSASMVDIALMLVKQRMGISITINPPKKE